LTIELLETKRMAVNEALHHIKASEMPVSAPLDFGLCPEILLGMPHLTPFGLSRTWLLKELGHRHWLMLAHNLGLNTADFRTPDGMEAYAAISALKIDVRLCEARSNSVLSIHGHLYPVSQARSESHFLLDIDGAPIGSVVLQSVFVARKTEKNRSIRRCLIRNAGVGGGVKPSLLSHDIDVLRRLDEYTLALEKDVSFQPCPFEEFNGAGLFYFAEFLAMVGRAFWHWEGPAAAARLDRPHAVLFTGNIEPGETLRISLHSSNGLHSSECCTVERTDGSIIASVLFDRAGVSR